MRRQHLDELKELEAERNCCSPDKRLRIEKDFGHSYVDEETSDLTDGCVFVSGFVQESVDSDSYQMFGSGLFNNDFCRGYDFLGKKVHFLHSESSILKSKVTGKYE